MSLCIAGLFFLLLANPLVIILLIASAASAILGERVNASIIVLMVGLMLLFRSMWDPGSGLP
jgi:hypothetical protein